MNKRFYSALDAANLAATISRCWINEGGESIDPQRFTNFMRTADIENPLQPGDPDTYYIVTPAGDIGFTTNNSRDVYWIFRAIGAPTQYPQQPQMPPAPPMPPQFNQPTPPLPPTPPQFNEPAPPAVPGAPQYYPQQPYSQPHPYVNPARIGYSPRYTSAEFQQAIQKTKRNNLGCAIAFIAAPLIIVPIYTMFSDNLAFGYGLLIGLAFSAFFALIYGATILKTKLEKPWEGVVESKKQVRKRIYRDEKRRDEDDFYEWHDIVIIRRDNGSKHTIDEKTEHLTSQSYHYFRIGDRVRFLAGTGLSFPYEKFDKSNDTHIVCNFCRHKVPLDRTHCEHCHQPLLN